MDIYIKKKKRFEINSISELEKFIKENEVKKYFIKFNDSIRKKIQYKIDNTDKINLKQLKTNFISEYFVCGTFFNKQYWIERGYSIEDACKKIKKMQTNNSNKFREKRKENPNKYVGWINTTIDFWIKRGYSKKDAELKMQERQSTFSRKKMIDKYGKEKGNQIVNIRNKKWLNTLKQNNNWDDISYKKGNNGLHEVRTLKQYINYYGELIGHQKYAKRYWGLNIKTNKEFINYQEFLAGERTPKFYGDGFRKQILEEQNFKCGECGISNTNIVFDLHHIDYDKKNDDRKNLIFLCRICHGKTSGLKHDKRIIMIEYYETKNRKFYEKEI